MDELTSQPVQEETIIETTFSDDEELIEKEAPTTIEEIKIKDSKIELGEDEPLEIESDSEEDTSSSIQYILVTAETQTMADYSPTLVSIDDKLDTIVSCSVVVMVVVVLSWIHLISRKRRNHK